MEMGQYGLWIYRYVFLKGTGQSYIRCFLPVFYVDLVYKLRNVKGAANLISSDSKYKKRLLLRSIHHFKSDLINNMDHMRILDTDKP